MAEEQLLLPLQLRAVSMTTGATGFDISADNRLFSYNQGPRIWEDLSWPVASQSDAINISFYNNAGLLAKQGFAGEWALLRFLFASHELVTPQQGNTVTIDYQFKDQRIRLQYRVKDETLRLSPDLFLRLRLPPTL